MTEERKASQVILELEKKIDTILAYIQNMDMMYKILLERLKTSNPAPPPPPPPAQTPLTVETEEFTFVDAEEVKLQPAPPSPFPTPLSLKEKLKAAMLEAKKEDSAPKRSERQIPVQQRICYEDGKNVYMATVQVLDSNGNIVKETRTNNVGKWSVTLSPGDYQVKITKSANNVKPQVELTYPVSIPNQDSVVQLETKKVS